MARKIICQKCNSDNFITIDISDYKAGEVILICSKCGNQFDLEVQPEIIEIKEDKGKEEEGKQK